MILQALGELVTLGSEIREIFRSLKQGQQNMTAELVALQAQVAQTNTVIASAVTLIEGIAAQLLAIKDDPAAIAALAADLQATTADLAAAVAENTPPTDPPPAA